MNPIERKIFLLRHAYAEPLTEGKDADRALTLKGINAARTMGRKLAKDKVNIKKIMSSTATRAMETTINIAEEMRIKDHLIEKNEKIYNASVRELMEVIHTTDNNINTLLLIGHNPSISFVAEFLTHKDIGSIKPCGLVGITFNNLKWNELSQNSGTFDFYYHPHQ